MKEKISTLLDDELDIKSSSQAVSEIIKDKRLRERFETYQLIRDSMNNELSDATLSSQAILDAIDKEPIQIQFNKDKKLSDVIALSSPDWMTWPIAALFIAVLFVGAMITMNPLHMKSSSTVEIAQDVPNEYIEAHQMLAPTSVAFYVDKEAK
jgi:sigma-E factor negative regulatory protein RseA